MTAPKKPTSLPLIITVWILAATALTGGTGIAMSLADSARPWLAIAVLLASLLAYGVLQREALMSAHEYRDAHHKQHRKADEHGPSTLPQLVVPPAAPLATVHPFPIERTNPGLTAVATAVGVYPGPVRFALHSLDDRQAATTVMPVVPS